MSQRSSLSPGALLYIQCVYRYLPTSRQVGEVHTDGIPALVDGEEEGVEGAAQHLRRVGGLGRRHSGLFEESELQRDLE